MNVFLVATQRSTRMVNMVSGLTGPISDHLVHTCGFFQPTYIPILS